MRAHIWPALVVALSGVVAAAYAAETAEHADVHPAFRNLPPYPKIVIPATSARGTAGPVRLVTDSRAPCHGYLEIDSSGQAGRGVGMAYAIFEFEAKWDGGYHVWARVWRPGEPEGLTLCFDDGEKATLRYPTRRHWAWLKIRRDALKLARGKHTLRVRLDEKGLRLGQILLITDRHYIPYAVEK